MVLRPYGDVGSQHTATAARGLLPSHHAVKGTTSLTRAPACHSRFLLHSKRSAAISSAVSFRFFFLFCFPTKNHFVHEGGGALAPVLGQAPSSGRPLRHLFLSLQLPVPFSGTDRDTELAPQRTPADGVVRASRLERRTASLVRAPSFRNGPCKDAPVA